MSKEVGSGQYQPVAATHPPAGGLTRNMKKVPRPPEQVRLRTGDRLESSAREGDVLVFRIRKR